MSSFSSTSRHITFTKKSGTFSSYISCALGDVYVDYENPNDYNDYNYTPLYSNTNKRVLKMNITNSMGVQFNVLQNAVWKINGENLATTPSLQGLYEASYDADGMPQLTIKGSIAAASRNQSITILCEAMVGYNGGVDTSIVRGTYQIPVRQSSGNVYHVTIAATDAASNFTINNGTYLDVRCIVYDPKGIEQNPSQYQYKWYKMQGGNWVLKVTNNGNANLRVSRDDIDNQALYKVEVFAQNTGGNGFSSEAIGADTQTLYDALDEYTILATPSVENEQIEAGVCEQINYKITIWNLNKQANAEKALVSFYLHDAAGVLAAAHAPAPTLEWVNNPKNTPSGTPLTYGYNCTMFSVTLEDCVNAGGSLILDITAQITEG